jgi:hypothetical protein
MHGHTQHCPGFLGLGGWGKPGPHATDTQAAQDAGQSGALMHRLAILYLFGLSK